MHVPTAHGQWNCMALETKRCLFSMFHVIISVITQKQISISLFFSAISIRTKKYNKKINDKIGFAY